MPRYDAEIETQSWMPLRCNSRDDYSYNFVSQYTAQVYSKYIPSASVLVNEASESWKKGAIVFNHSLFEAFFVIKLGFELSSFLI